LQNREAQQFDDSEDEALFSITHSRVDVERSGNRKLLAFAVREHGDDKYARILRFMLHTSKDTKPMMNWVAVKKPVSKKVLGSYLFSAPLALHAGEMVVPNSKQFAENVISQNCHPLSTVQRDASWFQARRFRVTATYAANCLAKDFSGRGMLRLPEVAEQCVTLQGRLDELVTKSWFSFSRSTEAMKRGQVNEGPVFRGLKGKPWAIAVFETGVLCRKDMPWFAASPDALLIADMELLTEGRIDGVEVCCVEIKSGI
jgi:hypothetical protein